MRKLGLIGGISWAATESYYRKINAEVQRRSGPECSPPIMIDSLNACDLLRLSTDEQWAKAARVVSESAKRLETAGASALLICANAMYKVEAEVQASINIPIINIVDPVGRAMKAAGVRTAAVLGTRNVMAERWYRQRLVSHGVSLVPAEQEHIDLLDHVIYDELMRGEIDKASERDLRTLITKFDQKDVDAVVLASTELSMIIDIEANVLPIYDSATLHAMEGVSWILGDTP